MSESNRPEFEQLLARHLDGELSPEEGARFADLLKQDPANAKAFAQASVLHQQVRSMLKLDRSIGAPAACDTKSLPIIGLPFLSELGFGKALAILSLLISLVGVGYWRLGSDGPNVASIPTPREEVAQGTDNLPPTVSSLKLESGSATLALDKIGLVRVFGPADFELLGPLKARLNRGQIKVRVTEPTGHGFEVDTPGGKVIDLGTEFSVDVDVQGRTGLVVHEGTVNVHVMDSKNELPAGDAQTALRMERLEQGDGVIFERDNPLSRIMSIITEDGDAFLHADSKIDGGSASLIAAVSDNLHDSETKKFYEIVPRGLREDVLACVDRPEHEWNGLSTEGMPAFLVGADYVKCFCDDSARTDLEIRVTLNRPVKLYVFYDDQLKPPQWLRENFRKLDHKIGRDCGKWREISRPVERGVGPGVSIDHAFEIWECDVTKPGTVLLGANGRLDLKGNPSDVPYMYGIAAIALDQKPETGAAAQDQDEKSSVKNHYANGHQR